MKRIKRAVDDVRTFFGASQPRSNQSTQTSPKVNASSDASTHNAPAGGIGGHGSRKRKSDHGGCPSTDDEGDLTVADRVKLRARNNPIMVVDESNTEGDIDNDMDAFNGTDNRQRLDSNASASDSNGMPENDNQSETTNNNNHDNPEDQTKAIRLVDYVLTMPQFQPKLRLLRLRQRTIDVLTRKLTMPRDDASSSYDSDSNFGQDFGDANWPSDHNETQNTSAESENDNGEDSIAGFTDGRNGPNLPPVNMSIEKAKALRESSLSVEDPTFGERSSPTTEESEDLLQALPGPSHDSGLTPSVTTVFDSGRSNDSGASTSRKLSDHLVELDKMIADAENKLHGTTCVCHKCIQILNVDGNDSPDISAESSAASQDDRPEARPSARLLARATADKQCQETHDNEMNLETQMPVRMGGNPTSGLDFEPTAGGSGQSKPANVCQAKKKTAWNEKVAKSKKGQLAAERALNILDTISNASDDEADDNSIARLLHDIDENIQFVVRDSASDVAENDDGSDHEASDLEEAYQNRRPRVRRSWDSDSETTTSCDETDYSDAEDLRNFFADADGNDLRRAKDHPLLGKEPKDYDDMVEFNDTIQLDSSDDEDEGRYNRELQDRIRSFSWVDSGPEEELPSNLEEILHFPNDEIVAEDPQEAFERLLHLGAKHHVPLVFLDQVWRICQRIYLMALGEAPKGFFWLRQQVIKDLPSSTLHYTLKNVNTDEYHYVRGSAFRRSRYPAWKYSPLVCETRANLQELMKYHAELHQGQRGERLTDAVVEKREIPISFYVDGVSPSTTGSMKMICEVIRHKCCNLILNYNTIIYSKDYAITAEDLLQGLLRDLSRYPNIKVELVVCDMPERLRLCGHTHFNGVHGCLHCFAKGEKREGAPGVTWPASTMGQPLRDDQSFEDLPAKTQELGCTVGGQKTRSPLLNIPNFSIVDCVVIEPMHLFAGLSRYMWEKVAKHHFSARQIKEMTEFMSKSYCELSFPTDFKRDRRAMDPPKWRANEWKQFIALMGIDIGNYYESKGHHETALLWHRYTWILRMMAQGDVWYRHGTRNGKALRDQIGRFYKQFETILGKDKCVPNLHALYHLPDYRDRMPLTAMSAEKAESFYGVNRRSFKEQSASIGKQIHVNTLLAAKRGHACETTFKFRLKRKKRDMDHLMVDRQRQVFCYLGEHTDGDKYRVTKVHCMPFNGLNGEFNWRDCGVMQLLAIGQKEMAVFKKDIIARAVVTPANMLYVWTKDLQEF